MATVGHRRMLPKWKMLNVKLFSGQALLCIPINELASCGDCEWQVRKTNMEDNENSEKSVFLIQYNNIFEL